MTPTLDTAAIRRRFEQAIIGIRQDGTMAVLVKMYYRSIFDNVRYFDLVTGYTAEETDFPTLIRPGDRCEVLGKDQKYHLAKYISVSAWDMHYPIIADVGNGPDGYRLIRPFPAAEPKPEPETGQHFNALEYWLTHGLKREQEWDKIRQIFRNALGDNPGCPFCLSYISETEPNPLLTRLTAAEQELAAIRAELNQVQK